MIKVIRRAYCLDDNGFILALFYCTSHLLRATRPKNWAPKPKSLHKLLSKDRKLHQLQYWYVDLKSI